MGSATESDVAASPGFLPPNPSSGKALARSVFTCSSTAWSAPLAAISAPRCYGLSIIHLPTPGLVLCAATQQDSALRALTAKILRLCIGL